MKLIVIAAVGNNGVIGVDNDMPWRIPEDFKHFRETTMGNTLVVGLNTYLTLPNKAFEGRKYIVLTRKAILDDNIPKRENVSFMNYTTFNDLYGQTDQTFFVAGGAVIYDLLLDSSDSAIITWVNLTIENGNKLFPISKLFTNFTAVDDSGWLTSKNGIEYKIRKYKNNNK